MKIIKDNYSGEKEKKSKEIECEKCSSVFEYDINDTHIGAYGAKYVKCPLCGYDNITDDYETLTLQNVRFPIHYYNFKNGIDISNEKIDEYVRICIWHIRKYNTDYCMTSTGNTMIFVTKMDGDEEFFVYVCKNGYETAIAFEDIDYKEDFEWH